MTESVNAEFKENTNIDTNSDQSKVDTNLNQSGAPTNQLEEDPKERDWRKWRENRQKEREEAERINQARLKAEREAEALRKALEAAVNKPSNDVRQNYFEGNSHPFGNEEESEEARIDKRVQAALAKQQAEYERKRREIENQEYPQRLQNTFKDFHQVCTQENVDYLEYHHPELAKSLNRMEDGFDKWADVYSAIKRYIPNLDSRKEADKANKNLSKPQSLSHAITSEGTKEPSSFRELERQRAARYAEMQKEWKTLG